MRQYVNIDINTPVYTGVNSAVNGRRPYQPYGYSTVKGAPYYFAEINQSRNASNTHYNSLQTLIHGKIGKSVDLNASYVWSKTLGYSSPVNPLDLRSSYGAANTDARHRLAISALINFPRVRRFGAFGKYGLSGWQLNDITIIQSGKPFTITSGVDENQDGVNLDYPDIVGDPYTHVKGRQAKIASYLNVNAFVVPPSGRPYGNEQRNSLYLPTTTNLSLTKEFPLRRKNRFQFRAEAYNALGNVNFIGINTGLRNLTVGGTTQQLQTAGPMRMWQLGARYIF
jgi:hypothetical protein